MSRTMDRTVTVTQIASICHATNKAYCESIGDFSQLCWDDAPDWQRESAKNGVNFKLANLSATPEQQHQNWLVEKIADGWQYGPVKDATAKTHPCCVPYTELSPSQRVKDLLFGSVVLSFVNAGFSITAV